MSEPPRPPAQLEFFDVPSPCIGVCQTGPKGYCLGCYRSREERLYWLQIDDATKRQVLLACRRRKQAALRRKPSDITPPESPVQRGLFDEE